MRRLLHVFIASVLLVCAASAALAQGRYEHLAPGNPSNATEHDADNYLMAKPFFALSYNNSKGTPNWVSWHLTDADLGSAKRMPFYPDQELPRGFNQVVPQ